MQGKKKRSAKQILEDLREEVKSSQNMLLVGIDIGKTRHCACFMVSTGKLLRQAKFYQKKMNLPKVLFGMEPSGFYWVHLYESLDLQGKRAVTVSPLAVRRNRETLMYLRTNQTLRMSTM